MKHYKQKTKYKKINPICYLEGQYITKCCMQYGENCPRVCRLFDEEQGEPMIEPLSMGVIKGIEKMLRGKDNGKTW